MLTRRSALAGITLAAPAAALAEAAPQARPFPPDGSYLPFWQGLNSGTPGPFAGIKDQYAAMLGQEAIALEKAGRFISQRRTLPSGPLRAHDAITRIVEACKGRRVVFLNEAHNCSRHRAFLARLLAALRPEGFTHLAAETFLNSDDPTEPKITDFKAGAAFDPECGFYTHDPVYAEAVRDAVNLGYRLVPYEQRESQEAPAGATNLEQIAAREQAETDNFLAFLKAHPEARVLVHVGYAHLREAADMRGSEWFAMRLKQASGLDPLTIGQSETGSFGPHAPDGRMTREVINLFKPTAPIIVEGPDGVSLGSEGMATDLAIFHPRLPDVRGRPGWWAAMPGRRWLAVKVPPIAGPLLAQAIHAGDPEKCVPADHVLLDKGGVTAWLRVRPGRYRLRLETLAGFIPLGEITV